MSLIDREGGVTVLRADHFSSACVRYYCNRRGKNEEAGEDNLNEVTTKEAYFLGVLEGAKNLVHICGLLCIPGTSHQ